MGKRAGWIGGAAFLIVLILAGTWLLVASPRLESAAQTQQMAEDTRSRNDLLELQVARLRADFALLDEYRAELAEIQVQIPPTGDLDRILDEVHGLAEDADVFVVAISPGLPEVVTFAQPAPVIEPAPEPTEGTEGDGAEPAEPVEEPADPAGEPTEPTEPEPTGPVPIDGFVAVPFQITVLGEFDGVVEFMDSMQTGMDRLYLVTEIAGVRQQETPASGGKPDIEDGHVELTISGYTYVLANDLIRQALGIDEVEEEPGEMPRSDSNPFEPFAPTGGGGGGGDD